MAHIFYGASGCVVSFAIGLLVLLQRKRSKIYATYNLDPSGDPRHYEPQMARYLHLSEYTIGIATGSIVLIVGSSALHGNGGRLPWFFASPLVLISASVIYGLGFMVYQTLTYEGVLHGSPYTALQYAINETLGFSTLLCFALGYLWLILAVTNFA